MTKVKITKLWTVGSWKVCLRDEGMHIQACYYRDSSWSERISREIQSV